MNDLPPSGLESTQSAAYYQHYLEASRRYGALWSGDDVLAQRVAWDDVFAKPGLELVRARFPIDHEERAIAGVRTDVFRPVGGVSERNRERVLINLHGGAYRVGAGPFAHVESIPIAATGLIEVVTVDYRMYPEYTFLDTLDDIATVYEELLERYPAENIGIYGCSAGGWLAAQSIVLFRNRGLPVPGAAGAFHSGATLDGVGDSWYWAGEPPLQDSRPGRRDPYLGDLDRSSPLVSPARHLDVLEHFPPMLLISGTRDMLLSSTAYFHAQLVKAGVDARLHVWEGAPHCSFAAPLVDLDVPETWEAWSVIVKFFDRTLGVSAR
jgi:acetyl esterase/lipase